jgi:hypothetical protein
LDPAHLQGNAHGLQGPPELEGEEDGKVCKVDGGACQNPFERREKKESRSEGKKVVTTTAATKKIVMATSFFLPSFFLPSFIFILSFSPLLPVGEDRPGSFEQGFLLALKCGIYMKEEGNCKGRKEGRKR